MFLAASFPPELPRHTGQYVTLFWQHERAATQAQRDIQNIARNGQPWREDRLWRVTWPELELRWLMERPSKARLKNPFAG